VFVVKRVALYSCVVLLLASCASNNAVDDGRDGQPKAVDVQGALAEYRDAQKKLPLPEGVRWPLDTPTLSRGNGGMFEYAVGLQEAQAVWYCAWAREAATKDGELRKAAIEQLVQFPKQFGAFGMYALGDEGTKQHYDDLMKAARLGDASPLQEHVATHCKLYLAHA
jgi:hypothetical protein